MTDQTINIYKRSITERIFHGVLFEILAIGMATPLAAWLTGESLTAMGVLSAVISLMAIAWNMFFNWLFDLLQQRMQFERNMWIRVLHACAFEVGLIILAVPFIAWWIDTTLLRAFTIDIGLILFFLPYSFLFNLCYDKVKTGIMRQRQVKIAHQKS